MFADYEHIARVHVYDKCVEFDITWREVEQMLETGEVIEEHAFDDLMVKEIRLHLEWQEPLHVVYIVHHDRKLVVYRTIYIPTPTEWEYGFRRRRRH